MALRDITEIDSLEHDTANGQHNSIVKIDDTHFILAYTGNGEDGFIKTFSVDENYDITEIDSLEHNTSYARYNSLVKIDDTHFILAFTTTSNDGRISTFSIDENYDNITQINTLDYTGTVGVYGSLIRLDATHFALACNGGDFVGTIKTFSINGSYVISEIDSIQHDTTGSWNSLAKIDDTHFALAYNGDGNKAKIKTFSVDGNYDNITEIDSLQINTSPGTGCSFVYSGSYLALAYSGEGGFGDFKTFSIDSNYDNITEIDSFRFDSSSGSNCSLVRVNSNNYVVAYTGASQDGFIKTFSVDSNGDNITELSSLEHNITDTRYNSICQIDDNHFVLAYADSNDDGFVKTFNIEVGGGVIVTGNFFQLF